MRDVQRALKTVSTLRPCLKTVSTLRPCLRKHFTPSTLFLMTATRKSSTGITGPWMWLGDTMLWDERWRRSPLLWWKPPAIPFVRMVTWPSAMFPPSFWAAVPLVTGPAGPCCPGLVGRCTTGLCFCSRENGGMARQRLSRRRKGLHWSWPLVHRHNLHRCRRQMRSRPYRHHHNHIQNPQVWSSPPFLVPQQNKIFDGLNFYRFVNVWPIVISIICIVFTRCVSRQISKSV